MRCCRPVSWHYAANRLLHGVPSRPPRGAQLVCLRDLPKWAGHTTSATYIDMHYGLCIGVTHSPFSGRKLLSVLGVRAPSGSICLGCGVFKTVYCRWVFKIGVSERQMIALFTSIYRVIMYVAISSRCGHNDNISKLFTSTH